MARHVHAENIIIAANDTSIEWEVMATLDDWIDVGNYPTWREDLEYRQKQVAHLHQSLIDQAKADPSIQWQLKWQHASDAGERWIDVKPLWSLGCQYRQKPEASQETNVHQQFIDMKNADPSIKFQLYVPRSGITNLGDVWHNTGVPPTMWSQSDTYRVKPTDVIVTVYHWAVKLVHKGIPELSSTAYMFETLEAAQKYAIEKIHPSAKVLGRIEGSEFTYWTEK